MKNNFFLIVLSFVFLQACSENNYYQENVSLPQTGWDMNEAVVFNTQIDDMQSFYNLKININYGTNYAYNNLWLFIKTTSPSNKMQIDTINCFFTDYEHNWTGKCNKEHCNIIVPFADSVKFIEPGVYKFEIIHGLRENVIQNINEIGLIIEQL